MTDDNNNEFGAVTELDEAHELAYEDSHQENSHIASNGGNEIATEQTHEQEEQKPAPQKKYKEKPVKAKSKQKSSEIRAKSGVVNKGLSILGYVSTLIVVATGVVTYVVANDQDMKNKIANYLGDDGGKLERMLEAQIQQQAKERNQIIASFKDEVSVKLANLDSVNSELEAFKGEMTAFKNNQNRNELTMLGMSEANIKINSELAELKSLMLSDPEVPEDLLNLRGSVEAISKQVKDVTWRLDVGKKKFKEIFGRVDALESQVVQSEADASSQAERYVVKVKHPYKLKISNDKVAIIVNTRTDKPKRVTRGSELESCGAVVSIDARKKEVLTHGGCTINTKSGA